MVATCRRIADSGRFQAFIFAVIVLNAVVLGLQTYDLGREAKDVLTSADDVFLGIFVVELAIRIAAYGKRPWQFFTNGWNVFDFIVIGAAFAPGLRENATLLRLVRLARVVRVVSVMPDLRILVRAMARSVAPITSLVVLTVLLMYVYAMIGWIIFGDEDPGRWGDIGQAMLSLFQILTLENWPAFLDAGQEIAPASWVYFVSYVLLASFLVINVLIAILINSLEEVHEAERAAERAELDAELAATDGSLADRLQELRHTIDRLEAQLTEGHRLDPSAKAFRRPSKGGRMRG